jgi:uncharacterized glyoxalase superfamily protein PhnB
MRKVIDLPKPRLMPVMYYRNAPAAIDWLCRAFGFERHYVATADGGTLQFAQLAFGREIVMLCPLPRSEARYGRNGLAQSATPKCYFLVPDADAHCATAKAMGAEIIDDIGTYDHGGRGYSCRDPEGHVWIFGTYDPWQKPRSDPKRPLRRTTMRIARGLLASLLLLFFGAATIGWVAGNPQRRGTAGAADTSDAMAAEQRVRAAADLAGRQAAELARLQAAKVTAQHAVEELRGSLAREESKRHLVERNYEAMQQQLAAELDQLRAENNSALESIKVLSERLTREEDARQSAEATAHAAELRLEELLRATALPPKDSATPPLLPAAERAVEPPANIKSKHEMIEERDGKAGRSSLISGSTYTPAGVRAPEEDQLKARTESIATVRAAAAEGLLTRPRATAPAQEKPVRATNTQLTERERQLWAARAKARCRALFPNSSCE